MPSRLSGFVKWGPFLRSATELLLIVVGVLLALTIEAWWEGRQDRLSERAYIESLLTDAMTDLEEFRIVSAELAAYRAASGLLSETLRGRAAIPDGPETFMRLLGCSTFMGQPVESDGTINDLLSTGNLALLRDRSLRRDLLGYYARIEASAQFLEELRHYQEAYRSVILKYSPLTGPEWLNDDGHALVLKLGKDPIVEPALARMRYAQRRMELRTGANLLAAESLLESLRAALRATGGQPESVATGLAPSGQFQSNCIDAARSIRQE